MVRFLLWVGAVAALLISLSANGYFWFATMAAAGPVAQAFMVSISALSGLFKAVMPAALKGKPLWPNAMLWILVAACLAFDMLSGLGFSRMNRDGASLEKREHNAKIAAADRRLKDAEGDKTRLAAPKVSLGRLRADLAEADRKSKAATLAAGDCGPRRAHVTACTEASRIAGELAEAHGSVADAEAYEAATVAVAVARASRAALGERQTTDPQAEAMAEALAVLGIAAPVAALIVGGLMLLILELGSTVAVTAAHGYRPPVKVASAPEPVIAAPPPGGFQVSGAPRIAPNPTPKGATDLRTALDSIRAGTLVIPGCHVAGSHELQLAQEPLAKALQISKPTVGRALRALEAAGAVSVQAGRGGTVVKFRDPPLSS